MQDKTDNDDDDDNDDDNDDDDVVVVVVVVDDDDDDDVTYTAQVYTILYDSKEQYPQQQFMNITSVPF